jgi:tetratricopeptide (TPR) repeat protein
MPSLCVTRAPEDLALLEAAGSPRYLSGAPVVSPGLTTAVAVRLRDRALAELDEGKPAAALVLARRGLATLMAAGCGRGLEAASLLIALAEIEQDLNRFADATATITAAIALLGAERGAGSVYPEPDRLMLWCLAHEHMAGLERRAGRFSLAAERLAAILDAVADAFGETSPAVVGAANALGLACKQAGDHEAAQAAYGRAMAALQGQADPDPLVEAQLLHNLAGLAHSRGDTDAGILLAERGLALRTGALGSAHPDIARDRNSLGALYHAAGRYVDAGHSYHCALAALEMFYGPDHFEVAMTYGNMAALHVDQGFFLTALSLGTQALRALEQALGPDAAETAIVVLNLAKAVAGLGRPAEAADLADRASRVLAGCFPAEHPQAAAALQVLTQLR